MRQKQNRKLVKSITPGPRTAKVIKSAVTLARSPNKTTKTNKKRVTKQQQKQQQTQQQSQSQSSLSTTLLANSFINNITKSSNLFSYTNVHNSCATDSLCEVKI